MLKTVCCRFKAVLNGTSLEVALGQDMGDVFVLPEGEDRGRVVLDEAWGLVEEVLGREAVVVAAIDEVVGGLCPGGHEMTAGGQRKKAPVGP